MRSRFDENHYDAMLVKIDNNWWGEKKDKPIIDIKAFLEIIETKEPNMKVDNTIDTIVSYRHRMSGFEKCPICQKMMKSSKDGEIYWLEKCNDFYHITCIR